MQMQETKRSDPHHSHVSSSSALSSASSTQSLLTVRETELGVFHSFPQENPFEHSGFVFQTTLPSMVTVAQSDASDLSARSAISEQSGDTEGGMHTPSWHGDIREGDDEEDDDDVDDDSEAEEEQTLSEQEMLSRERSFREERAELLLVSRCVSNSTVEGFATLVVDNQSSSRDTTGGDSRPSDTENMDIDRESVCSSNLLALAMPTPLPSRPPLEVIGEHEPSPVSSVLNDLSSSNSGSTDSSASVAMFGMSPLPSSSSTVSFGDPSGPPSHRSSNSHHHMFNPSVGSGPTATAVSGSIDPGNNPRSRSSVRRKSMSPRTPASALLFERSPPCRRRALKWRTKQPSSYRTSTDESETSETPSPREDLKVQPHSTSAPSAGGYHR
jgi:hypothetical protein